MDQARKRLLEILDRENCWVSRNDVIKKAEEMTRHDIFINLVRLGQEKLLEWRVRPDFVPAHQNESLPMECRITDAGRERLKDVSSSPSQSQGFHPARA